MNERLWPELDYVNWKASCETLRRWVQIVGKIRLRKSPWVNHSWNATFYVSARGLTTSVIHDQTVSFSIEFDFTEHVLRIMTSGGSGLNRTIPLVSESVASFHAKCIDSLEELGIRAETFDHHLDHPNELVDATPFSKDLTHC